MSYDADAYPTVRLDIAADGAVVEAPLQDGIDDPYINASMAGVTEPDATPAVPRGIASTDYASVELLDDVADDSDVDAIGPSVPAVEYRGAKLNEDKEEPPEPQDKSLIHDVKAANGDADKTTDPQAGTQDDLVEHEAREDVDPLTATNTYLQAYSARAEAGEVASEEDRRTAARDIATIWKDTPGDTYILELTGEHGEPLVPRERDNVGAEGWATHSVAGHDDMVYDPAIGIGINTRDYLEHFFVSSPVVQDVIHGDRLKTELAHHDEANESFVDTATTDAAPAEPPSFGRGVDFDTNEFRAESLPRVQATLEEQLQVLRTVLDNADPADLSEYLMHSSDVVARAVLGADQADDISALDGTGIRFDSLGSTLPIWVKPNEVESLEQRVMDTLAKRYSNNEIDLARLASGAYFARVLLHSYVNANGRTARAQRMLMEKAANPEADVNEVETRQLLGVDAENVDVVNETTYRIKINPDLERLTLGVAYFALHCGIAYEDITDKLSLMTKLPERALTDLWQELQTGTPFNELKQAFIQFMVVDSDLSWAQFDTAGTAAQ
jgi:hypothetical protein